MNDKIYLNRLDDTLRYRAIAQRTLTQETLCVSINVTLLVSVTQTDQAKLHRQIRDALNRFMPEVDWIFSTLYREGNRTVGFEQIIGDIDLAEHGIVSNAIDNAVDEKCVTMTCTAFNPSSNAFKLRITALY